MAKFDINNLKQTIFNSQSPTTDTENNISILTVAESTDIDLPIEQPTWKPKTRYILESDTDADPYVPSILELDSVAEIERYDKFREDDELDDKIWLEAQTGREKLLARMSEQDLGRIPETGDSESDSETSNFHLIKVKNFESEYSFLTSQIETNSNVEIIADYAHRGLTDDEWLVIWSRDQSYINKLQQYISYIDLSDNKLEKESSFRFLLTTFRVKISNNLVVNRLGNANIIY